MSMQQTNSIMGRVPWKAWYMHVQDGRPVLLSPTALLVSIGNARVLYPLPEFHSTSDRRCLGDFAVWCLRVATQESEKDELIYTLRKKRMCKTIPWDGLLNLHICDQDTAYIEPQRSEHQQSIDAQETWSFLKTNNGVFSNTEQLRKYL